LLRRVIERSTFRHQLSSLCTCKLCFVCGHFDSYGKQTIIVHSLGAEDAGPENGGLEIDRSTENISQCIQGDCRREYRSVEVRI